MEKITFIHAADLHLDSPFRGLSQLPETIFEDVRQSTFRAFDRLITLAIKKEVDFIIITGDLFDHEHYSLKAQIYLRNAFQQLQEHQIHVYLSYGNHDFIKNDRHTVTFPENVFVFPNEEVTSFVFRKSGRNIAKITGFSYEKRAINEEKTTEFPMKDQTIAFHIGMLHGSLYGNIEHHAYAPFQLHQLQEKRYDYWALGHIHKKAELSADPPIIYPGNIQGRHRKETGEKGCYLVELSETGCHYSFMPLQMILFKEMTVDLNEMETMDELENYLSELVTRLENINHLLHLTWTGNKINQFGINTENILEELIDILNERLLQHTPWQYIYQTKMDIALDEPPIIHSAFMEELSEAYDDIHVQNEISELLSHPDARRLINLPKNEELIKKAKQTVVKLLQKSEDES